MKLLRICSAAAMIPLLFAVARRLPAQLPTASSQPPAFEVASVKPSVGTCPPVCGFIRPTVGNQGYHVEGATIRTLLTVAYTVTDRQISGGPDWMNSARFDIEAKDSQPHTVDELHSMLQRLLEERFQLKVRHEARQETVAALTVVKGAANLTPHDPNDKDYPPISPRLAPGSDGTFCMGLSGRNVTMDYFAFSLSRILNRNVTDQTGLPGRYDLELRYAPDVPPNLNGSPVTLSADCRDMFSALPNQLGLRLESAKGPVPYLVVEKLEKPTAN